MELKDYQHAHEELDSMIQRWGDFSRAYSVKAEMYMREKDTTAAVTWLDKSLKVDPYDGEAWMVWASINMSRGNWQDAEQQLSKAIHLKPKLVSNYVNRALVRLNVNNLRGAMADYDMAIDLDPNNFLAHYNRGLLRVQVGDDNRAIEDFNYVLRMEPGNLMATYNRATLHHRTGNLRAAIVDYTKVIEQYPNFWTGLHNRADCYRRLGMHRQAELDEFRILKAQMDKHVGIQPRWTKNQRKQTRKKSEIDFSKYNQIVVEDEEVVEREYESAYRGRIQNRKIDVEYMPMYEVSYLKYANVVSMNQVFDKEVEAFNRVARPSHELKVTCNPHTLDEEQSAIYLNLIDTLSRRIDGERDMQTVKRLLLQRAVAYGVVQNFDDAVHDMTTYLQIDSTSVLAYWQRAVCLAMESEFSAAQGMDTKIKMARVLDDLNHAIALDPQNAFLFYNRGNLYVQRKEYERAIEDYTAAISINRSLAEAYYNRGLAYINSDNKRKGLQDLSKAGELGLYKAYSVMKKYSEK